MSLKQRIIVSFSLLIFPCIISCAFAPDKTSASIPRISKETLRAWLNDPSVILLDVRLPRDWKKSGEKIKGAAQENPAKFAVWQSKYPKTEPIVLY